MNKADFDGEWLKVAALYAFAAHALLIFGVSFDLGSSEPPSYLPSLDVTLVTAQTLEAPDEADFLAQANQLGGGSSSERKKPEAQFTSPDPLAADGVAPVRMRQAPPRPVPDTSTALIAARADAAQAPPSQQRQTPITPPSPDPSPVDLDIARLKAQVGQNLEAYARRPRRAFVSANTRQYEFATYMQNWVARVERIGRLNFPDEARIKQLKGEVVLTVAVRSDGSVERVSLVRSSGQPVLDEAARRIVDLAAPFAPFPDDVVKRADILHITRTWEFEPGSVLSSR